MEVQEQESVGRWDGLSSRDATSRIETMENIQQVVMKKIEAIKPMLSGALSPSAVGSPPNSDLNAILAHLLMLSKRCPFEDVRALSGQLLQAVQVGNGHMVNDGATGLLFCVVLSSTGLCSNTHTSGIVLQPSAPLLTSS